MGNIANIGIRPMTVYLGSDIAQVQKITCLPSTVAASLGAKYFLFQDSAGAKHYAWFNTGASIDPAPAGGWTGHEVALTNPDTSDEVATALAAILDAVAGFDATASGAVVTLTHTSTGFANPAYDPEGAAKSGFAFEVLTLGSTETDIGCVDGDIEVSGLAATEEDITCHAEGTTVLGRLITGYEPIEVTVAFKETDKASLKRAMIAAGHFPFLPVGASASEVFGYGVTAVGKARPTQRMRLHPVNKGSADRTEDLTFWKVSANPDSLNFSGESIQTIPLTFTAFVDSTKNKEIQFFMVGDSSQSGLGI